MDADYERALQLVRRRHDLIGISLVDPRERELPDVGFIALRDAETGEQILVDTRSSELRRSFARRQAAVESRRAELFGKLAIDEIRVDISRPYIEPLIHFFRSRIKRKY